MRRLGVDFFNEYFAGAGKKALSKLQEDMMPGDASCPEILVLELTQQCNFRCMYCIYSGAYRFERSHSDTRMSEADIDHICTEFFSGSQHPDYVSFYGGEPLLSFDLIKRLCDQLDSRGITPKYSITTNGSLLLHEGILAYLLGHDFHVNVSYDGLNHDCYRNAANGTPTSEVVMKALRTIAETDRSFFARNVTLSVTLAPPYQLLDNYRFFSQHNLLSDLSVSVNLVNEDDNLFMEGFDLEKERIKLAEEVRCLAEEYVACVGPVPKFLVSIFANSALRIDDREMDLQARAYPPGQCNVGVHRLFISATGDMYTCERVGDYGRLGQLDGGGRDCKAYQRVICDMSDFFDRQCQSCHLVRVCDMCCSALRRGSALKDDDAAIKECEGRRRWYDLVFYVYLSRKELGKGMFDD